MYSRGSCGKEKEIVQGLLSRERQWGVWTTPEMSGQGSHNGLHHGFWESKGMYEDEYTAVI